MPWTSRSPAGVQVVGDILVARPGSVAAPKHGGTILLPARVAAHEQGFVWFAIGLVLLATGRRPEIKAEENL
ncbi:hypothetical protein [Blastococcus saxobsidens]|uniref:hypothetical protein n=1 Tax=Blastococcus saxobsidens TaxID=138336 RepID=UPI00140F57C9|nr:hypothetical protein [Blastococcus saxobsidens]